MDAFIQGFLFGLAYVMPIGMQNLYVINSAARGGGKITATVFWVVFFDVSLALGCFWGIGALLDRYVFLREAVLLLGAAVIFHIAWNLWKAGADLSVGAEREYTMKNIIAAAFSVAWLNPQAVIDGSLLLGSFRASLPEEASFYFIAGVCAASCVWFSFLAFAARSFMSRLKRASKYINNACAAVLALYGFKLICAFCMEIFG